MLLAGCAERGDFDRPKNSFWNQTVLPVAGIATSALRGDPVSWYAYTDDEREMRDRAWRFVMPAHEKSYFERVLAELAYTGILPAAILGEEPGGYLTTLRWQGGISPVSRFRRLGEDILADRTLIPPFCAVAQRVLDADATRRRSMPFVTDLSELDRASATARMEENRRLIGWVGQRFSARERTFRHALEHLVIETPQVQAIEPERALLVLREAGACIGALDLRGSPALAVPGRAVRRPTPSAGAVYGK